MHLSVLILLAVGEFAEDLRLHLGFLSLGFVKLRVQGFEARASRSSFSMRSERSTRNCRARWGGHQKGWAMTAWMLGRRRGCGASIALIRLSASVRCAISFRFARPCGAAGRFKRAVFCSG